MFISDMPTFTSSTNTIYNGSIRCHTLVTLSPETQYYVI